MDHSLGTMEVVGYLSIPCGLKEAPVKGNCFSISLNGRPVHPKCDLSKIVTNIIKVNLVDAATKKNQAEDDLAPVAEQPHCFLFLSIPSDQFEVHQSTAEGKAEIVLGKPDDFIALITECIIVSKITLNFYQ